MVYGWMVITFYPFPLLGKEVINMETFLGVVKEIRNGIIRALSAHFFQKVFLDEKKTTQRRDKQKGGLRRKK